MGVLIFCQNLGAGVFLTVAQTIFSNSLQDTIVQYAPGVDPGVVLVAGAAGIRSVVSGQQLVGVLLAYSTSADRVMYLGAGLSVAAFCCAWGMGWKDMRKAKESGK
jgi:hypothetical protein